MAAIKPKSFAIRPMFMLALGCAALVAHACGGDDTLPEPGGPGDDCHGPVGAVCPAGQHCDHPDAAPPTAN